MHPYTALQHLGVFQGIFPLSLPISEQRSRFTIIHPPDVSASAIFISRFDFSGDVVERLGAGRQVVLRKENDWGSHSVETCENMGAQGVKSVQRERERAQREEREKIETCRIRAWHLLRTALLQGPTSPISIIA